jgi:hypothetical protein
VLRCGISIRTMSVVGQSRRVDTSRAVAACLLRAESGQTCRHCAKSALCQTGREQTQQHAVRGRQSYSITSLAMASTPREGDGPGVQISSALVDQVTPPEQTTCGQVHEAQLVPAAFGRAP